MKKLAILLFSAFILVPSVVSAEASYDVSIRVLDERTAQLRITYPVSTATPRITAIPTEIGGELLDGFRELVSATAQDGTSRSMTAQEITGVMKKGDDGYFRPVTVSDPLSDVYIEVRPGDTSIAVAYRLFDQLESDGASFFSMPLILGGIFPVSANITVIDNPEFEIISEIPRSVGSRLSDNEFDLSNMQILVVRKNGRFMKNIANNFLIAGLPAHTRILTPIAEKSPFVHEIFRDLFDANLPARINVVIAPITHDDNTDDPDAVAIRPDIIIVDPESLTGDVGPNDAGRIFFHEIAHLAIANKKLFSGQLYGSRWLDESLAVFAEQYITDAYFLKTDEDRRVDAALSNYGKLSLEELKKAYALPFDYDFMLDTDEQSIHTTYSHAGLALYNVYLHDKGMIKKWLGFLQKMPGKAITCGGCDTDLAVSSLQGLTGWSREEIMFPHKNDLSYENPYLSKLLAPQLDDDAIKKIKASYKKNVAAKPVIKAVSTSTVQTSAFEIASTSQARGAAGVDPVTYLEPRKEIKQSFFDKFVMWLVWLFD